MRAFLAAAAALFCCAASPVAQTPPPTATPIRHLIVVVGENLSFDNLFATYEPPPGETVRNLLSQGIVDRDGNPGPNFALAAQHRAEVREKYQVTPPITGVYRELPRPGTTYAVGQPRFAPDERFPPVLPNGPFQITRHVDYAAHVGDPVHRFFQMWQQFDGGKRDLFVWTAETSGEGSQHRADPDSGTNQGGVAMGFYNMAAGDAPYLRQLARIYTLSDNHHQPVMGGSGANFQALATGHAIAYWRESALAQPPQHQIENPDPVSGSNNWYKNSSSRGGSYVNCLDPAQPGAAAIQAYLTSLPYRAFKDGNCEPGAYYLVNNYRPGFSPSGKPLPLGPKTYRVPPQPQPTIAEALAAKGISWKWYSGGRSGDAVTGEYSPISDPLTYSSAVMTTALKSRLQDQSTLFHDIENGDDMPAVAFVIPPNSETGHPAYSTIAQYETFLRRLIDKVQANKALWAQTAILVTVDESGGMRLLGQRLCSDPRFLRRRHPHPADRGLARRQKGRHRPCLQRPCVDPEIHRGELAAGSDLVAQPRPSAEPRRQPGRSLRPGEPAGDRRPDEPLSLLAKKRARGLFPLRLPILKTGPRAKTRASKRGPSNHP